MEELGLKAKDLEHIIGSKGHLSSILSGRREITLKVALKLKNYFQLPAEMFYLHLILVDCIEKASQLSKLKIVRIKFTLKLYFTIVLSF